ncbi:hypothetical protein WAI453_003138 [Rhynchosporium graminicola]|uniref:Uncharacterized protein n=1 Tax=Rhynchosporium graminicola TaxID=2792576 RepID=A0A1E1LMZ5_9HELO|nr:uncharacterized protein RCO7_07469 [Rhynchosporium commune]
MSDVDITAAAGKAEAMSQADTDFILVCIKNAIGGVLTVDGNKIAAELNYTNPRSVTNKISAIKKKYGLPISTASASKTSADFASAPLRKVKKTPGAPKTPNGKITKRKATPKKTSAKKAAVKTAVKVESESESEQADAEMEDAKEEIDEEA